MINLFKLTNLDKHKDIISCKVAEKEITQWYDDPGNHTIKTWGGFDLSIFKVNLHSLWKNRSFTIGLRPLTSYCYPPVETYWHDHVQALKPRIPFFLDSQASTSTPACVSLSYLMKQLNDHQVLERISSW